MKKIILLLTIVLGMTSGCEMSIDQETLPKSRAFKDEFTREFMKSTEETEEGYYTFESKTKGYTILFPRNATLSVGDYSADKDKLESLSFGEERLSEKISYFIRLNYEDNEITDEIDTKLKLLSSGTDYEGEYKKIEKGDKVIYLSDDGPKNKDYYYFLAYVKSAASNKAIRFSYVSNCNVEEQSCELITEKAEERINKILYSIKFVE
ncbi:hypothetical protein [Metabacillus sp. cB07]|uniref:hypothetical protein n=1 Tax=Metabacillus sp. cB07 TaxID=2806989 RepID=UPI00193A6B4F|nr:hypothetical protein [Metabacillus sp. cB07]